MTQVNVNVHVFSQDNASVADERKDGSLQRAAQELTTALTPYDTDRRIPQNTFTDLATAINAGVQTANETDGPDVLAYTTDLDVQDRAAVEAALENLPTDVFVVLYVVSNQLTADQRNWGTRLDDKLSTASRIDVIYVENANLTQVVGDELVPWLADQGVSA